MIPFVVFASQMVSFTLANYKTIEELEQIFFSGLIYRRDWWQLRCFFSIRIMLKTFPLFAIISTKNTCSGGGPERGS